MKERHRILEATPPHMTFQIQVLILCTVTLMYKQSAFTFHSHSLHMTGECSHSFSTRLFCMQLPSLARTFSCVGIKTPKPKKGRRNRKRHERVPCPASSPVFSLALVKMKRRLWVMFLQICKMLLNSLNLGQIVGFYVSWDDWSSQTLAQFQSLRAWNIEVCLVILGTSF